MVTMNDGGLSMVILELYQGDYKKDLVVFDSLEEGRVFVAQIPGYTLEKEDSFDVEYFNPKNLPAITLKLDELYLTSRLDVPRVQETFKKHLWSIPPSNTSDATQLWYGLQWSSNSDSLFWNEYYSLIRLDENYLMTDFELAAKVARDE